MAAMRCASRSRRSRRKGATSSSPRAASRATAISRTKLWNAARYAAMNGCALVPGYAPAEAKLTVNRWIASALARCAARIDVALEDYKFNDAADALYHFIWHTFCDWYLEFTKPILAGDDEQAQAETRAMTAWVTGELCHLLHPIMPFITEALWRHLAGEEGGMMILRPWPAYDAALGDADAVAEMEWVVGLISAIRTARAEMNVPAAAELSAIVIESTGDGRAWIGRHRAQILRLARLASLDPADATQRPRQGALQVVHEGATILLDLAGAIDFAKERARLEREAANYRQEISKSEQKLANPQFVAKAKPEAIEEQREREANARAALARVAAALQRIGA